MYEYCIILYTVLYCSEKIVEICCNNLQYKYIDTRTYFGGFFNCVNKLRVSLQSTEKRL